MGVLTCAILKIRAFPVVRCYFNTSVSFNVYRTTVQVPIWLKVITASPSIPVARGDIVGRITVLVILVRWHCAIRWRRRRRRRWWRRRAWKTVRINLFKTLTVVGTATEIKEVIGAAFGPTSLQVVVEIVIHQRFVSKRLGVAAPGFVRAKSNHLSGSLDF